MKEAFDNTGWILNITVTGYKEHDNHRVLNYLSSPNVVIWTAACASCAVPGIFDPVELLCKNEYGQIVPYHINSNIYSYSESKYIDGTISNDIPMKRIAELFNVNTFIVSQTNPFVFPFLDNEDGDELFEVGRKLTLWRVFKYLLGSEMKHRCTQVNNR
jgi:TAG lipase/steryl ester hydrolase/phospholipase A2/LPA acyltransferase